MRRDMIITRNQGWKKRSKPAFDYSKLDSIRWLIFISYCRWFPDRQLDFLESKNAEFGLAPIQRLYKRISAHNQEVFITATRGTSKSYIAVSEELQEGINCPRIECQHVAPGKEQAANIVSQAFGILRRNYPKLLMEWKINENSQNSFSAGTAFGSTFSSDATLPGARGGNTTRIVPEEVSQQDTGGKAFGHKVFQEAYLPRVRFDRYIRKEIDYYYIPYKKLYITSATYQQNPAFAYRQDILDKMLNPPNPMPDNRSGTGVVIGNSWRSVVFNRIRQLDWALELKRKLSPGAWEREMESVWGGTNEDSIIKDTALYRARSVMCMEDCHCEKPNVHYFIGYDVASAGGTDNARCAYSVIKSVTQKQENKWDRLLKSQVYTCDFEPPQSHIEQARLLKKVYFSYTPKKDFADTGMTIICIDAQNIGDSVVAALMSDINDGYPPLKCVNGFKSEIELDGAIPCILPIKAFGSAPNDPEGLTFYNASVSVSDMLMLDYAVNELVSGNVHILCDVHKGLSAYKTFHQIKDDDRDAEIVIPYTHTDDFCDQVMNLKRTLNSRGYSESRVSKYIQRDKWSAFKYALRGAQILEKMMFRPTQAPKAPPKIDNTYYTGVGSRLVTRHGGKRF